MTLKRDPEISKQVSKQVGVSNFSRLEIITGFYPKVIEMDENQPACDPQTCLPSGFYTTIPIIVYMS